MIAEIAVLNSSGDLKITWDPEDADAVANAREEVAGLRAMGYSFFIADGSPADEVAAGRGELTFRRVDDPIAEGQKGSETPPRRGRPPKAQADDDTEAPPMIAVPPMRGG